MNIEQVLDLVKTEIENLNPIAAKYLVSKGSQNGFELLVPDIITSLNLPLKMEVHLGHHFPDLTLYLNGKKYGIELKSRSNGSWVTNGNSVLESISDEGYEMIYLLFGSSIAGVPRLKVRYAAYWQVTAAITVTHSPRFKINMDAPSSVFESQAQYDALRSYSLEEKVSFLQQYLHEHTEGVKWFSSPKQTIMPISLNTLPAARKNHVLAEVLVLYPQDFIRQVNQRPQADYSRGSAYIIATYYYYSSSFRDFFSAGGKWRYNKTIVLPKVLGIFHEHQAIITTILQTASDDFKALAYESWQALPVHLNRKDFATDFIAVVNHLGQTHFSDSLQQLNHSSLYDILFN